MFGEKLGEDYYLLNSFDFGGGDVRQEKPGTYSEIITAAKKYIN